MFVCPCRDHTDTRPRLAPACDSEKPTRGPGDHGRVPVLREELSPVGGTVWGCMQLNHRITQTGTDLPSPGGTHCKSLATGSGGHETILHKLPKWTRLHIGVVLTGVFAGLPCRYSSPSAKAQLGS